MPQTQTADRRPTTDYAADTTINYEQAGSGNPAAFLYQASVEPMRRPDHKAKRHGRPAGRPVDWAERHARRERQVREWAL